MTAPTRPRGRRPGRSDTAGTIRAAASALFLRDGYEKVSLRAVAREAEVDPALVHHYFTSKAALFLLALTGVAWEVERDIATVVDGPTDGVGHRAVQLLLERRDASVSAPLAALVDGPQGEVAARARAAIEMVAREVFVPFFTTKKSGSGIGLPLSRQMMMAQDGDLSLAERPVPSYSTTFILTLQTYTR